MVQEIRKVAVLGAGNMGSGIAQACAQAGLQVTIRDLRQEFVDNALQKRIEGPLRKRVEAGKMAAEQVDALMANLTGTTDVAAAVADADLVIEAVFEDLKVKKDVFAEVSRHAPAHTVFATNTSSLSVTELAKVTDRPEKVAGLHFFFPAAINKLVEVVKGEQTSQGVFDALMEFSRRIGKIPIETADAAGFAVNRAFVPWVNESVRLLEEGVANIPTIDAAAKEAFQIGMGPFQLMNVTGVPISLHAERTLHEAFGAYYEPAELLRKQVEEVKADWDLTGEVDASKKQAVVDRLKAVAYGISARLVEEGVATPEDMDKGVTVGLRWAKGPFQLMNEEGTAKALELVNRLHEKWGDAFPVAEGLKRLGRRNEPWPLRKVRVEKEGHVAIVTIDRPEALNALNPDVLRDVHRTFLDLREDDTVRAVVLTGEGQKAFVAGADIKFMVDKTPQEARKFTELGQRVFREVEQFPAPVIAAINGFAFGGGLELALACDIRLASTKALLGLPEVELGIHPGFGGTQRLPRLIGPQAAKHLIYTAERFGAEKAKDLGLVLSVHEPAELLDAAKKLAHTIAAKAPVAIRLAKASVDRGLQADLDTGMGYELEAVSQCFATQDQKESMKAFLTRSKYEMQGK